MSVNQGPMSDRLFYAFAHPLHNRRFYLALVFSIILFPVIAIGLIAGTIFLVVPAFALVLWIGAQIFFARLIGNSILVSELNYPRINAIAEELKARLGYNKRLFIFVYEQGNFNAYMRYIFFRRAVFLNSELLESGVSDDEVRWIVGRFIGYMRARKQAGVLGWVIRAAQHLLVFNIFLLPYERAMVYTGDRLAVAAIDGNVTSAVSAMQKLLVGRQLGYSVNPEGIIEQQRRIKGTFFAFLARLASAFPPTTARYVDLIVFGKAFFPAQFAKFEAANPGLPSDLALLAASPQSGTAQTPENLEAAGRKPRGWVCAGATAAVILAVGIFGWYRASSSESYAMDSSFTPASSAPSSDSSSAASPSSVSLPSAEPAAESSAPALQSSEPSSPGDSSSPAAQSAAPTLPPHVHMTDQGKIAPDPGCTWASSDPHDLHVVCQ
ncbi:MAG TPA: hypothetical protein VKV77_08935 [Methylovirgula sp.]|nr:hypothetical protein [Methylovirgula sp.]